MIVDRMDIHYNMKNVKMSESILSKQIKNFIKKFTKTWFWLEKIDTLLNYSTSK